jgi:hypothetical protein
MLLDAGVGDVRIDGSRRLARAMQVASGEQPVQRLADLELPEPES